MTTETGRLCAWLCCSALLSSIALLAHGCAGANKVRHGDVVDVSSYPQDIKDAYEVFAVRCSRCHTLARPLNARIHDAQHWERYVARMRRNPSSGINEKNASIIMRFLLYYMHQQDKAEGESDGEPSAAPNAAADGPAAAPAPTEGTAPHEAASPRPVEILPAHGDQSPPATAPEGNP
jgi:hypothetical protein